MMGLLLGAMTGLFIILKLAGAIAWSWWWVFSPAILAGLWVVATILFFFGFFVTLGKLFR